MSNRELTYGNNAMYFLYELSQYESGSEDFLNGEFEVYGEDEQGRDGSATIDIVELATDVYQINSELLEALQWALPMAILAMEQHRMERVKNGHTDISGTHGNGESWVGIYQDEVDKIEFARAAINKATGETK